MRSIFHLLLFLVSISVFGQVDSLYISPFEKPYGVSVYSSREFLSMSYVNSKGEDKSFEPNKPISLGVKFAWNNSSISYSYGLPFMRSGSMGKSKFIDFKYNYYASQIVFDAYFQQYKGFSMANTEGGYDVYDDLSIRLYGISMDYVFNSKKFSMAAAYDHKERQLLSAGSWLLGGSFFYTKLNNVPLIDEELVNYDKRVISMGPRIGYGYNLVARKNLLIAATFSLGVDGALEKELSTSRTRFRVNPQAQLRFSANYQYRDWMFGITSLYHTLLMGTNKKYYVELRNTNIQFLVTKRFTLVNPPVILRHDFKDVFHRNR
ncbi:DUF4421 family protein [Myroides pelagicus]|uniref:DUF4421 family protein n=1 Tax=Myroides pelagicus TaxID=270914 RepID=UPI0012B75B71|nr:DUF4421 family protein [Myroides pelagicus]MEC4114641.1 DUF4421 family protein [Myroides pelagicus]